MSTIVVSPRDIGSLAELSLSDKRLVSLGAGGVVGLALGLTIMKKHKTIALLIGALGGFAYGKYAYPNPDTNNPNLPSGAAIA